MDTSCLYFPCHTCPGPQCHESGKRQGGFLHILQTQTFFFQKAFSILHLFCLFLWSSPRQRARASLFIFNLAERLFLPLPTLLLGRPLSSEQSMVGKSPGRGWLGLQAVPRQRIQDAILNKCAGLQKGQIPSKSCP